MEKIYGIPPHVVGTFDPVISEMLCYLYLPVKMPVSEGPANRSGLRLPLRLRTFEDIVTASMHDAYEHCSGIAQGTGDVYREWYVYLTAKTLWVEPGSPGNRPGWHVDGWGSNGDLNYIWHDMNPTEFAIRKFKDVPDDDIESMKAMEAQVRPRDIVVYPNKTLLRLDESVVHRVAEKVETGMRTFVKVSVSRHRYNLRGNSHNYLFDYRWNMHDRKAIRNTDNKDFVK